MSRARRRRRRGFLDRNVKNPAARARIRAALACAAVCLALFGAADRAVSASLAQTGLPFELLDPAVLRRFLGDVLFHPLSLDLSPLPFAAGAVLASVALVAFGAFFQVIGDRTDDAFGSDVLEGPESLEVYEDRETPGNNQILSKNVSVCLDRPPEGVRKRTSNNTLVEGPTGTGKTSSGVAPIVLQLCAYTEGELLAGAGRDALFTDTKGTTIEAFGDALVCAGVEPHLADFVRPWRSDRYNPLSSVKNVAGCRRFAKALMASVSNGKTSSEPIWDEGAYMETLAPTEYLFEYHYDDGRFTVPEVVRLVAAHKRTPAGAESELDDAVAEITTGYRTVRERGSAKDLPGASFLGARARRVPSELVRCQDGYRPASDGGARGRSDDFVQAWQKFRNSPVETELSITITFFAKMSSIMGSDIARLMSGEDEFRLDLMGKGGRPGAWFVISSDDDHVLDPLVSLAVSDGVSHCIEVANVSPGQRVVRPVQLVLDEMINMAPLEHLLDWLRTLRSRSIYIVAFLQSIIDFTIKYSKEEQEAFVNNVSTFVYLGGTRDSSAETVSDMGGQQTVSKTSSSAPAVGGGGSGSTTSRDVVGRAILTKEEVQKIGKDNCVVFVDAEPMVVDEKAHVWELPRYDPEYMYDRTDPKGRDKLFDYHVWRAQGRVLGAAYVRFKAEEARLAAFLQAGPWEAFGQMEVSFEGSCGHNRVAVGRKAPARWEWEEGRAALLSGAYLAAAAALADALGEGDAAGSMPGPLERRDDDGAGLAEALGSAGPLSDPWDASRPGEVVWRVPWAVAAHVYEAAEGDPCAWPDGSGKASRAVVEEGVGPEGLMRSREWASFNAVRFSAHPGEAAYSRMVEWAAAHPGCRDPFQMAAATGACETDVRMSRVAGLDWPAAHPGVLYAALAEDPSLGRTTPFGEARAVAEASAQEVCLWWPWDLSAPARVRLVDGWHVLECPLFPGGHLRRRARL